MKSLWNRSAALRFSLSLVFVLFCALWGIRGELYSIQKHQGADLRTQDNDTLYFVQAWEEAPHFSDTLRWWYGPWGQKYRPFYRPIPSLLFWTQYQVFGVKGSLPFHALLFVWHIVAVLVVWRFLCTLFSEGYGTLIAALWCSNFASNFVLMIPGDALDSWKDNVESWHAIAHVFCLWAFWRYLQTESRRWQIGAFVLFWVALCVKELAYMAPFLMLLLGWYARKWRLATLGVVPFFVLAGAMFFFRLWALQSMGFRMGSNNHWPFRLFNDNLGGAFTPVLNREWLILGTILSVLALWNVVRRRYIQGGSILAVALLMCFLSSYWWGFEFAEYMSRLLVPQELERMPLLAVMLFLWWRFFKNRYRPQIFGALFALILYAPLTSGPNTNHIFYFVSVGWSIWLFYALLDIARLVFAWYRSWREKSPLAPLPIAS